MTTETCRSLKKKKSDNFLTFKYSCSTDAGKRTVHRIPGVRMKG